MFLLDLLFALIIALLVGSLFSVAGRQGPWPGVLWFFVVIFLFTWTLGVWTAPFGPALWGVHWVPFMFFAVLVGMLLASAAPSRRPRTRREAREQLEEAARSEAAASVALSLFFWMVIIGLVAALAAHYI